VLLTLLIGTSLCLGLTPVAHAPNANALALTAKEYAKTQVKDRTQYKCLLKLWTLESNWNYKAFNKSGKAYGIPQIRNPILMRMNKYQQVDTGLRYLRTRYHGDTCKALSLWNKRAGYDWIGGWY
jgi:hypothetical protein